MSVSWNKTEFLASLRHGDRVGVFPLYEQSAGWNAKFLGWTDEGDAIVQEDGCEPRPIIAHVLRKPYGSSNV